MTNTDEKKSSIHQNLIQILEDGKLGYTNAAEHTDNALIKNDYNFVAERALYHRTSDRNQQTRKTTNASGGGALGAIHRAWMDIKSSFTVLILRL
jgi:hypothetical protein